MRPKNKYARMALLSLRVFLSARRYGAGVPKAERAAAKDAFAVLKPFMETAEGDIGAIFGTGPFPTRFFVVMLTGFINAERERRINDGADIGPVTDAARTLIPFLMMAEGLLDVLAAQDDGADDAN